MKNRGSDLLRYFGIILWTVSLGCLLARQWEMSAYLGVPSLPIVLVALYWHMVRYYNELVRANPRAFDTTPPEDRL